MPLYQTVEQHLRDAIESVLNQSYTDFEFLIINDSPESKYLDELVRSYQDSRIHYQTNERNLGITATRNRLMEMAQGEFLAIMDHDDISHPQRFEKQVAYLEQHADVGVVGCMVESFPEKGKTPSFPVEDGEIRLGLMYGCAVAHSAAMIRSSLIRDYSFSYESRFSPSEDYALWCRLLPHTRFYNLPESLFLYRWHESNTSKRQKAKMAAASAAIQDFVRLENPELFASFQSLAVHVTRYHLFGFIPLMKVKSQAHVTRYYLFGFLPLLKSRRVSKLA